MDVLTLLIGSAGWLFGLWVFGVIHDRLQHENTPHKPFAAFKSQPEKEPNDEVLDEGLLKRLTNQEVRQLKKLH